MLRFSFLAHLPMSVLVYGITYILIRPLKKYFDMLILQYMSISTLHAHAHIMHYRFARIQTQSSEIIYRYFVKSTLI